jgi:hypothetical protein
MQRLILGNLRLPDLRYEKSRKSITVIIVIEMWTAKSVPKLSCELEAAGIFWAI